MSTVTAPQTSNSLDLVTGGVASVPQRSALVRTTRTLRVGTYSPSERRKGRLVAALLVAAAVGVSAALAFAQPWSALRSDDAVSQPSHPSVAMKTVKVEHPARATSSKVVLPATVRPWQSATLYARVNGYLVKWYKDLGDTVKADEVLAEIETPELDQEVAQGEALTREAEAAAVQARAELQEAEADLKVAVAQLGRAQAEADLAASILARREKLLATRTISPEEFDTFQKQSEARIADLNAARSDVARRRTNLDTRHAIIEAREATAKSRQSSVDRLKELQAFKRIVAPFDGTITKRAAEVGMLVNAGKDSLFVVEDMSRVRVQTNVPQAYAMQARAGATATVNVPELGTQPVNATITRIANSVDSTSRTMVAEIELENSTGQFQPGSYAQVSLNMQQNASSWTIPTNTVQMKVEGPHVAVVDSQNRVEVRRVNLGRDLGSRVVVTGIEGNERLIVNPTDDLTSGLEVQVNDPNSPAALAQR
jgi:multidrug efflux pump subunit AcrA (membrane-fusion protein)